MASTHKPRLRVAVVNHQDCARVRRNRLREVAQQTLQSEGVSGAAIGVALLDDKAIRELNRRHLNQDCPTDVLAFGYGNEDGVLKGDIAVSVETARREAERRHVSIEAELALYVVHGLLHLLGYDDTSPRKRRRMWDRQREILEALGYPADQLLDRK